MGRRLRFAVRSRQAGWGRLLDAYGSSPPVASTQPGPEGLRLRRPLLSVLACATEWGLGAVGHSRSPATEPRPLATPSTDLASPRTRSCSLSVARFSGNGSPTCSLDCLQAGELSSYNTLDSLQPTWQQNRNPKSKISKKGIGTRREI